jgi:hypothetical protein
MNKYKNIFLSSGSYVLLVLALLGIYVWGYSSALRVFYNNPTIEILFVLFLAVLGTFFAYRSIKAKELFWFGVFLITIGVIIIVIIILYLYLNFILAAGVSGAA